jgi:ATP-binding cassette, subfamily C (CFTR/MRP), member 1
LYRFIEGLIIPLHPHPSKARVEDADYNLEMAADWFGLLTFSWMNSLMTLGYARHQEASDLRKLRLQDHRSAGGLPKLFSASFDARRKKTDGYNTSSH